MVANAFIHTLCIQVHLTSILPFKPVLCVISSFRRSVNYIFAFIDVTQRILVVTEVSGQPTGSIFKGQAVLDYLTLEDGTDRLSRNVGI
jgi:hypothetical protein